MIKLSVNETKWSSLLGRTGALILYILIWIFDFGPEKLPGPFDKWAPGLARGLFWLMGRSLNQTSKTRARKWGHSHHWRRETRRVPVPLRCAIKFEEKYNLEERNTLWFQFEFPSLDKIQQWMQMYMYDEVKWMICTYFLFVLTCFLLFV